MSIPFNFGALRSMVVVFFKFTLLSNAFISISKYTALVMSATLLEERSATLAPSEIEKKLKNAPSLAHFPKIERLNFRNASSHFNSKPKKWQCAGDAYIRCARECNFTKKSGRCGLSGSFR